MLFRVFFTYEKMFRLLTDPDPDLSLPGPGSSFSDQWQLYYTPYTFHTSNDEEVNQS